MIPENIKEKIGKNLHLQEGHPLNLIKQRIESYFASSFDIPDFDPFEVYDSFDPYVSTKDNFDDLLIPEDHVSRSSNDTYYQSPTRVLRTHTSAHQNYLLNKGKRQFLVTGDVYRKDTVDATHYPVFHQVEGVWVPPKEFWDNSEISGGWEKDEIPFAVQEYLHGTLEGLARYLFGDDIKCRWSDDYFPFTDPSWELEILFNGEWLEVLGCGLVQNQILANCGMPDSVGWAFGLGLERLAMILYKIPDIRLFWSEDPRFLDQFRDRSPEDEITFVGYSKYPPVYKDISFWIHPGPYHENNFHQITREVAGDLVEEVKLIDTFTHPKHSKTNHTYRITYRSMDRSLTNEEVNRLQEQVRSRVEQLPVELR
jgi:phenylalanyl-tRNA synthetase alpha chain